MKRQKWLKIVMHCFYFGFGYEQSYHLRRHLGERVLTKTIAVSRIMMTSTEPNAVKQHFDRFMKRQSAYSTEITWVKGTGRGLIRGIPDTSGATSFLCCA